ncbi:B-cell receptor CD22-like [Gadus chalcogrammus]|uniref:B-cell receptor CD22-like n=1 Tax=Gadus chalcogrammus TaxID=1042646 RepID=UPI0024C47AF5|nr:B-cell receptor CD22-like [Gadus chalcogrammus]
MGLQDLQVKVSFPYPTNPTRAKLECRSMCGLAGDPPYIWFRNGQNIKQGMIYSVKPQPGDSFSCAAKGYDLRSPLLYTPKTPSVTVSPSGEIEEGSSVTLSCSSDANPAATYTWFKVNRDGSSRKMIQGPQLVFSNILSSDSGQYRCDTKNELGKEYAYHPIDVKYGPKHVYINSSPSGEIEEGSSVTLSCSSDANPAAEYTWFKNNQPLHWEPSQPHTFPSVRPEDRGTYRCQAENKYGQLSSNSIFMDVQCELNIGLIC